MKKFQFKVYMKNGSFKFCVPSCIEKDGVELLDYDKYASDCGSLLALSNNLGREFGFDPSSVQTIKIFQNRGELEFSVLYANPYLAPVLEHVSHKKINGYGEHPYDGMVVDNNCSQFIEMKDYLFEQLANNSGIFLNSIYKYPNEFYRLLSQYVTLSNNINSEESMIVLRELKDRILKGLSMYKNYRGLCKARNSYEYSFIPSTKKNNTNWRTPTNIKPKTLEFDPSKFSQEPLYEMNQFVNDLGEEREEFLEIEELESEDCYGKRR